MIQDTNRVFLIIYATLSELLYPSPPTHTHTHQFPLPILLHSPSLHPLQFSSCICLRTIALALPSAWNHHLEVYMACFQTNFRSFFRPHLLKEAYSSHLTENSNSALSLGFPGGWVLKICLLMQEMQFQSLGQEDSWKRKWQPTLVFLPGGSHGWRNLTGYSPWGCLPYPSHSILSHLPLSHSTHITDDVKVA